MSSGHGKHSIAPTQRVSLREPETSDPNHAFTDVDAARIVPEFDLEAAELACHNRRSSTRMPGPIPAASATAFRAGSESPAQSVAQSVA